MDGWVVPIVIQGAVSLSLGASHPCNPAVKLNKLMSTRTNQVPEAPYCPTQDEVCTNYDVCT